MLSRTAAALVVIDIQDKLFAVMHDRESLLANAVKLIKGAMIFNLPVIVTEQTPQKIGSTVAQLTEELNGIETIAKESFSSWANKTFKEKVAGFGCSNFIIMGIECHVCVYQTAVDLMANGYSVHVVSDAVSSRTRENCIAGLAAMRSGGVRLTSTEMVLFELLGTAADPKARDIFKIVK